jgi:hypothetical protein
VRVGLGMAAGSGPVGVNRSRSNGFNLSPSAREDHISTSDFPLKVSVTHHAHVSRDDEMEVKLDGIPQDRIAMTDSLASKLSSR